jgi:hypothetical protein
LFGNWVDIKSTVSNLQIHIEEPNRAEAEFRSLVSATSKASGSRDTWKEKVRLKLTRMDGRWLITERLVVH